MPKKLIKLEVNRQLSAKEACQLFQVLPDIDAIKEVGGDWSGEWRRAKFEASHDLEPRAAGAVPIIVDGADLTKTLRVRAEHVAALQRIAESRNARLTNDRPFDPDSPMREVVLTFLTVEMAWRVATQWFAFQERVAAPDLLRAIDEDIEELVPLATLFEDLRLAVLGDGDTVVAFRAADLKDGGVWPELRKDVTNDFLACVVKRWCGFTETIFQGEGPKRKFYKIGMRQLSAEEAAADAAGKEVAIG